MKPNDHILIFDSGIGGIGVLKKFLKVLPHEKYLYFGDSKNAPYGDKDPQEIIDLTVKNILFLIKKFKNIKAVVIACNTSSIYGSLHLKRILGKKVFIFDIFSSAYDLVNRHLNKQKSNKKKNIGIIGTKATINSQRYQKKFKKNKNIKVYAKACSKFAYLIEKENFDRVKLNFFSKKYLTFFKKKKIKYLLLACTHYSHIKDLIKNSIDEDTFILNPNNNLVFQVKKCLEENKLLNLSVILYKPSIYTSGDKKVFKKLFFINWNNSIDIAINKMRISFA